MLRPNGDKKDSPSNRSPSELILQSIRYTWWKYSSFDASFSDLSLSRRGLLFLGEHSSQSVTDSFRESELSLLEGLNLSRGPTPIGEPTCPYLQCARSEEHTSELQSLTNLV